MAAKAPATGVVIGRFQAHHLTDGHRHLFAQVATRSARVLVLIWCPPVIGTKRDPLEYLLRARMVQDYWTETFGSSPDLAVLPCLDCPTNEEWAHRVDQMIEAVSVGRPAVVFMGEDSGATVYETVGGRHPVERIDDAPGPHATRIRGAIVPRHTEDFRAGVVYAIDRRFNNPYPVVDVAIFRDDWIVLIRKQQAGAKWRLPGGFVEVGETYEAAAIREAREETGLQINEPVYAGSTPVQDWRYPWRTEGITTALFTAGYSGGNLPVANDDAYASGWFEVARAPHLIHDHHAALLTMAVEQRQRQ